MSGGLDFNPKGHHGRFKFRSTPLPLESHHSVSEPNPCIEYAMMLHTCDVEGGGGRGGKALRRSQFLIGLVAIMTFQF